MTANDSYDSDGGLEEISIGDSNKQLMDKWYSINKHLKSEKEKVKEKRRNHHLLCAQQKKSKSVEVTQKPGDKDSPQKLFESKKKVNKKAKRVKFDTDNVDESEADVVAKAEKLTTKPVFSDEEDNGCSDEVEGNETSEDFIAFDKKDGGVKPVCLKDLMKVDPGLESALAFKNKHLFGRHVHRQPMSSHLAMAEKRRARYPKQTNLTR